MHLVTNFSGWIIGDSLALLFSSLSLSLHYTHFLNLLCSVDWLSILHRKNHHIHTLCTILGNKKKGAIRTLRPLPWCYFGYNKNFFPKKKTDSGQIKCLAFRSFNEEKRIELNGCDEREIHWPQSLVCVFHSHLTHAAPRRLPKGKGKKDPKALIDTNKWYNNPNFPFFLNNITGAHTLTASQENWVKKTHQPSQFKLKVDPRPSKKVLQMIFIRIFNVVLMCRLCCCCLFSPNSHSLTLTVRWVPWLALVWLGREKRFHFSIHLVCVFLFEPEITFYFVSTLAGDLRCPATD